MQNFIQSGNTIDATAPYAVSSGQGALIAAALFGVAAIDIANGVVGPFELTGVVSLAKTAGAGTAWTEGAKIYWDNAAKAITKTAGGNTLIGAAILPLPLDADVVGVVRLNASF